MIDGRDTMIIRPQCPVLRTYSEAKYRPPFAVGVELAYSRRLSAGSAWQAAQTPGNWTLSGCAVAPSFDFSGFELAPGGWSPL
jgi:uncharacterized protein